MNIKTRTTSHTFLCFSIAVLKRGQFHFLLCDVDRTPFEVFLPQCGRGTPIRKIICALRLLKGLPGFKMLIHQNGLHFFHS